MRVASLRSTTNTTQKMIFGGSLAGVRHWRHWNDSDILINKSCFPTELTISRKGVTSTCRMLPFFFCHRDDVAVHDTAIASIKRSYIATDFYHPCHRKYIDVLYNESFTLSSALCEWRLGICDTETWRCNSRASHLFFNAISSSNNENNNKT